MRAAVRVESHEAKMMALVVIVMSDLMLENLEGNE
jgi:hypothetical protein